jgi:predicted DCC family thiol-disulfide oxidoreductase YuxK
MVNFIIRKDRKKILRFAALQSDAGQAILKKYNLPTENFETFIFIAGGKIYKKSTAALKISQYMPWYLRLTQAFWIFPAFFRDGVYEFIARNRYKWFGKRNSCMVPSQDVKNRFL